mmetsp:Transcript_43037/g.131039  ORF Transcript_43037/g.131039 Transcript_43037/m.131039 type:complete len:137 (+) Transcript_43037:1357-1767(+)
MIHTSTPIHFNFHLNIKIDHDIQNPNSTQTSTTIAIMSKNVRIARGCKAKQGTAKKQSGSNGAAPSGEGNGRIALLAVMPRDECHWLSLVRLRSHPTFYSNPASVTIFWPAMQLSVSRIHTMKASPDCCCVACSNN